MPGSGAPSLARDYYQRFIALDDAARVAFLRGLVNSSPPAFETEWLEFKPYPYRDPENTIKDIWSKTIAAFANIQGGVLLWGIGTKTIDKVDSASTLQLVPAPDQLRTQLFELHHQATDPPLPGVEITPVSDPGEGGKGFVVCFIPQGSFVPYRAEYSNRNYYIRVGDDSIIPSPVILRRLFYPQSLARIEAFVRLTSAERQSAGGTVDVLKYEVFLVNSGAATAHDVYVLAHDNINYSRPDGKGLIHAHNWHMREGSPNKSGFYSTIPIHPEFRTLVATSYEWSPDKYVENNVVHPNYYTVHMKLFVYCRDMDCQAFDVEFSRDEQINGGCEKKCTVVNDRAQ
jgi:hypothetical protein